MTATAKETLDKKFNMRCSVSQLALFSRAAEELGISASAFVLQAASTHAENVLALRRHVTLEPPEWDLLVNMTETPTPLTPKMQELLDAPSTFRN